MKKRHQLAALVLAAALTISGNTILRADNHSQVPGEQPVTEANLQKLQGLTNKQLRKYLKVLRAQYKRTKRPNLRLQIKAARKEQARRLAGGTKPADAPKLSRNERQARQLLRGAVDANSLRTPVLEDRVRASRQLLRSTDLRNGTRNKLTKQLRQDQAELQNRKAAAQQVTRAERQARLLLQGPQASTLRTAALRERIAEGRKLLATGQLKARTQTRLEQLVAADRTALQAREARQQAAQAERRARRHLDQAVAANRLSAPALRERIRESRQLLQSPELKPRTRQDLKNLVQTDRAALDRLSQPAPASTAERQARDLLVTSVTPDKLTGRALRERIRDTRTLLQEPTITRRTRIKLQARLDRDQAELRKRQASQRQSKDADEQARRLLTDGRSARDLSKRQLQGRLRETRDVLQDPQLSQRYSRRLRERLRDDRREMRRRVEARRPDGGIGITVDLEPRQDAAGLLSDRRPSHALRTKQLSRRIRRARRLTNSGVLSSYDRSVLSRMLESDRRELRHRLRTRRDRRRAELDRLRRNNEINIVIAPQVEYAPRDDVAAAEADDETIERQLVAPPTREISRRYSMDEFRRRPELRNLMPAIEVDSIRFGFNEHFVREEEIDQLERIGAVIERVVAANRNEVILIEGHTDAVGSPGYNLDLSVKRADAVRNALIEFFVIDPANLVTIGYGEQFLKIPTPDEEQENRRVSVRRITPLLASR